MTPWRFRRFLTKQPATIDHENGPPPWLELSQWCPTWRPRPDECNGHFLLSCAKIRIWLLNFKGEKPQSSINSMFHIRRVSISDLCDLMLISKDSLHGQFLALTHVWLTWTWTGKAPVAVLIDTGWTLELWSKSITFDLVIWHTQFDNSPTGTTGTLVGHLQKPLSIHQEKPPQRLQSRSRLAAGSSCWNEGPFQQKKHSLSYKLLLPNSFICTEKPRKHAATILSTLHLQELPDTDDNQVALPAILPGRGHQEFDLRKTRARAIRHKLVSGKCFV